METIWHLYETRDLGIILILMLRTSLPLPHWVISVTFQGKMRQKNLRIQCWWMMMSCGVIGGHWWPAACQGLPKRWFTLRAELPDGAESSLCSVAALQPELHWSVQSAAQNSVQLHCMVCTVNCVEDIRKAGTHKNGFSEKFWTALIFGNWGHIDFAH